MVAKVSFNLRAVAGENSITHIELKDLKRWCSIPVDDLPGHPEIRVRFRLVADSQEMGQMMARELVELIETNNAKGRPTRAIIPCGPKSWYGPFTELVNSRNISLSKFIVFHMDECLDWQGQPLPPGTWPSGQRRPS